MYEPALSTSPAPLPARRRSLVLEHAAGAFQLLMLNLVLVCAVWGVALHFRSQLAQLAGHRVMMDLRSDRYRHVHGLSRSFENVSFGYQPGKLVLHARLYEAQRLVQRDGLVEVVPTPLASGCS